MCRCAHCHGRFFKLIETRCMPLLNAGGSAVSLFYKKRCKRCKMKVFFRKDFFADGTSPQTHAITGEEWVKRLVHTQPVRDGARMTIFASEYSKRVARNAEKNIDYMKKRGGGHAQSA